MVSAAWRLRNRCFLAAGWLASLLVLFSGHSLAALSAAAGSTVLYGLLVFKDLFDPVLIGEVHGLREPEPQLDMGSPLKIGIAIDSVTPDEHRDLLRSIVFTHEAIRTRLCLASPTVRQMLADTYRHCTAMAQSAIPMVLRGQSLSSYLSRFKEEKLEAEVRSLEISSSALTRDDRARAIFERARSGQVRHLDSYRQVRGLCERIRAQLIVINTSMQNVEARLVRLISFDGELEELNPAGSIEELADQVSMDLCCLDSSTEALDTEITDVMAPWAPIEPGLRAHRSSSFALVEVHDA